MKKNKKTVLHIMIIALLMPSAAIYAQDTQPVPLPEISDENQMAQPSPEKSLFERAGELGASTLAVTQEKIAAVREKLPVLPDKLKKIQNFIAQKSYCLFKYDKCTKRDKLLISNAFGFMLGYGFSPPSLFNLILPKLGIKRRGLLKAKVLGSEFYIIEFAAVLSALTGFTGPLFMGRGVSTSLPHWIQGYMASKDNAAWINDMKGVMRESTLFILVLAIEAYMILQEAAFALKYDGNFSLRNLGRYLKMNAQCIWDEKYCKPEENAEGRRQGLYFWMGFLEGVALHQLTARIWLPKMTFSPEEKRRTSHLSRRSGLEFAWYEVLNISPRATDREITTAYHRLARQYHPDTHPGLSAAAQKTYEGITGKITDAYATSKKQLRWFGSYGRTAPPSQVGGLLTPPAR